MTAIIHQAAMTIAAQQGVSISEAKQIAIARALGIAWKRGLLGKEK